MSKNMNEAPPFWFQKPHLFAWSLAPISVLYGLIAARRMRRLSLSKAPVPVLCVGNFIVGGAGKTPTAIAIAQIAQKKNLKVGFLSRGYLGHVNAPTVVDMNVHNARDVGDEPLILSQYAPTVVSPDRPLGAALLVEQGVNFIIMDDGFQNPSLHKDFSLAVIDARRAIGNGFCMPSGPLRAPLKAQIKQASALLVIGRSKAATQIIRKAAKMAKPLLTAEIIAHDPAWWQGKKVLAFAGIADPQKFFNSLESVGAEIVERHSFNDHHSFSKDECEELLSSARKQELILATTQKDAMRLQRMGKMQEQLAQESTILAIDLQFESPKMVETVIQKTISNHHDSKIISKTLA